MSYAFGPAALDPLVLSKFHRSIQTSDSSCTLWNGDSLASHSSQHVPGHSSLVSYHEKSSQRCFSRLGALRSAITAFNPLVA